MRLRPPDLLIAPCETSSRPLPQCFQLSTLNLIDDEKQSHRLPGVSLDATSMASWARVWRLPKGKTVLSRVARARGRCGFTNDCGIAEHLSPRKLADNSEH